MSSSLMTMVRLVPVFSSALLLGAHFLRMGLLPLVGLSLVFPALLFFRERWAARLVQAILLLASLEWLRTLLVLVDGRREIGAPWMRMALILGGVAFLTAASCLVFQFPAVKKRFKLSGSA